MMIEVKILNIPKIAISHEDEVPEIRPSQATTNSNPPSPYKSIIKNRSSQPPTPTSTSTTTQSYYTAPTRQDSYLSNDITRKSSMKNKSPDPLRHKKQIIDENDTENDVSEISLIEDVPKGTTPTNEPKLARRRGTISTISVLNSKENIPRRQYSLRQNRSCATVTNDNLSGSMSNNSSRNCFIPHVSTPPPPLPYAEKGIRDSLVQINQEKRRNISNPVRRTHSHRPSSSSSAATTLRRFIVRNGKLIEQEINSTNPIMKRRLTLDNSSYPMIQIDTSTTYETAKPEENNQTNVNNTIRLVTDINSNTQSTINDQSDMQLDVGRPQSQSTGVS